MIFAGGPKYTESDRIVETIRTINAVYYYTCWIVGSWTISTTVSSLIYDVPQLQKHGYSKSSNSRNLLTIIDRTYLAIKTPRLNNISKHKCCLTCDYSLILGRNKSLDKKLNFVK